MQQDNTNQSLEIDGETNQVVAEHSEGKHDSHHKTDSEHSSHSHHSKHHSHHHHKRSLKSRLKSIKRKLLRMGSKKYSKKAQIIIWMTAILVLLLMVGLIYIIDATNKARQEEVQVDATQNTTAPWEAPVNTAVSTQTVAVPTYWNQMIEEKTAVVKALQAAGGKDCVSFAWASDTHIPDNHSARTNDIGKVMAKMMDNCNIPFAVLTGDIGTRDSYPTEAELEKTQEMIPVHLAPLWGTDRLLMAIGNHDGCYGDPSSSSFKKQASPQKMWELYFRNQALDFRRAFSEDGTYFYVDYPAQKIRFIILNSQFGGEYLVDGNGIPMNDRFETSCYGQEQLDWLSDVALDMPEGYGAVITSHVPPRIAYTVDKNQLIGIINAYCSKSTYCGSYTEGVEGWTNSHIDVDFTDAKGEIIAMFTGHVHQDTVDTETLACPLITIISAGAQVNAGEVPERAFGTDTETSFDVVTINRITRTIYCTRIGAGEDRVIQY